MKRKLHSEEQIIAVLNEAQAGAKVIEAIKAEKDQYTQRLVQEYLQKQRQGSG